MKKILLFLVLSSAVFSLAAQTQVSGNQSGTWTAAYSPYEVVGDVVVPAGQSLKINPGVEVNFKGYYQFTVNGRLQALGTEMDSVYFTTDSISIGWGGIRVTSDQVCELSYCRIEYGKAGADYPDNVGGALALFGSNAVVSNCVFADNQAPESESGLAGAVYGINLGTADIPTQFIDCTFLRNSAFGEGGAMKFSSDLYTEITGCKFIGNHVRLGGGAIAFYASTGTKITRSLFVNNYTLYSNGGAISTLGFGNSLFFKNCTIAHNSANGGAGGGIHLVHVVADFVNTIIYENPGEYGDDLILSQDGEAIANYCNLKMPDDATGDNNIETDPLFVDADNLDYYLQATSPCIDTGNDIGLPFAGAAPDMGCFEYGLVSVFELAQKENVTVSPNPAQGLINLTSGQVFDNVQVMNLLGQVFLSQDLSKCNNTQVDVSSLNSGIYFERISNNQKVIATQKIIVTNQGL